MVKRSKATDNSTSNQFTTLISDKISDIDKLIGKVSTGKEFEFIFKHGFNTLNKELYIYLLKYINIISSSNKKYSHDGPNEMLSVNLSLDDNETYRITVNNTYDSDNNMRDNIKMIYSNLITKSSNYSVFKMLLYLVKRSKDNKKYNIMKKVRTPENTVDIEEFDIRVKLTDEVDMFDDVVKKSSTLPKIIQRMLNNDEFSYEEIQEINKKIMFRYKERTSLYFHKTEKSYLRMDLTLVKAGRNIRRLNNMITNYELELELVADKVTELLRTELYDQCERIVKLLQQSNFIINKNKYNKVIEYYKQLLLNDSKKNITALDARQAVSLEIQHVTDTLPDQYAVTDKADGERYFMIIYDEQVYLISNSLKVRDTGVVLSSKLGKKYNGSVLDGEYIFIPKYNRHLFMIFDCLSIGGKDIRRVKELMKRLSQADDIITECFINKGEKGFKFKSAPSLKGEFNLNKIADFHKQEINRFYTVLVDDIKVKSSYPIIRRKYFIDVIGAKKWEIFKFSSVFWKSYIEDNRVKFPYLLDGLIYHPLEQIYTTNTDDSKFQEYKWKPPSKNSIDFYIEFKRDSISGKSLPVYDNTNEIKNKTYKICKLYVGKSIKGKEQPMQFVENNSSGEAYLFLDNGEARDLNGDIISDKTVVEFYYKNDPQLPENYRWIPIRTRHDKTEFVERYRRRYGNYHTVATKIWRSISNPVIMSDFDDLAHGDTKYHDKMQELNNRIEHKLIISATKENQYYQKITKLAKKMRSFHNWIKSNIIYSYCHYMYKSNKQQSVLDIGCGRGGDNMKFYYSEVAYYVGLDLDQENILSPVDGAVSRYNQMRRKKPNFPKMYFIQADARSELNYTDQVRALSGMTSENRNLLNKFFPQDKNNKTLFDIINCQFAIHYFLENKQSWSNFKTNVNNHLRNGGFLLATTFDGGKIRKILKGKEKYTEYYTDENGNKKVLFDIVKKFDDKDKPSEGLKIDFHASWMFKEGTYHPEYIVDKNFIVEHLETDCELELVDYDTFESQFNIHKDYFMNYVKYQSTPETRKFLETTKSYYEPTDLNEGCQKFTNLNCYYIFRKKDGPKLQKGGNYDFSDVNKYIIPNMNNYDDEYSLINSVHNILRNHGIIPKSLRVGELCRDLGINILKDVNLENGDLKDICKRTVIKHELDNNRSETVLNGLNIAMVERDCNDHYDIEYITNKKKLSKDDKFVILMKEGHLYKPIYNNDRNGLFNKDDDIVKFLLNNGENIM
jgi:SAM-dependent methyltransferase